MYVCMYVIIILCYNIYNIIHIISGPELSRPKRFGHFESNPLISVIYMRVNERVPCPGTIEVLY